MSNLYYITLKTALKPGHLKPAQFYYYYSIIASVQIFGISIKDWKIQIISQLPLTSTTCQSTRFSGIRRSTVTTQTQTRIMSFLKVIAFVALAAVTSNASHLPKGYHYQHNYHYGNVPKISQFLVKSHPKNGKINFLLLLL